MPMGQSVSASILLYRIRLSPQHACEGACRKFEQAACWVFGLSGRSSGLLMGVNAGGLRLEKCTLVREQTPEGPLERELLLKNEFLKRQINSGSIKTLTRIIFCVAHLDMRSFWPYKSRNKCKVRMRKSTFFKTMIFGSFWYYWKMRKNALKLHFN